MLGGLARALPRGDYVRLLSAVYIAMFVIRVAFGIVIVILPNYVVANDFVYSLVVTASPLLELLTIVFAGVLIDRYGRKGVLLAGLGIGAFALYSLALTTNVWLLALVNAVHGIAAALILVTTLAVIATYAPADERGRAMGLFNLVNILGWISGFVVGSLLKDVIHSYLQDKLAYAFVIAGAFATIGLVYANRMIKLPPQATASRTPYHTIGALLRAAGSRRILLLTAPWLIVFMLVGAFLAFFPRVTDQLSLSGGNVALGILGAGVLMLASQYFWGRLADRHGRETIMLVGAAGLVALMGTIMFAFYTTESSDPEVIFNAVMSHSIIISILLFVALAFAPAGLAAIADEAEEGAQGTTMSAYSLTLSLGFIIGPPLLGAVSESFGARGNATFFAVLAAALFAMVFASFLLKKRESRRALDG